MDIIQSHINQSEARINQYEDSFLLNEEEKEKLINKEKEFLTILYAKKAAQSSNTNPEITL